MNAFAQGTDPQAVRANKLDLVERLADDLAHEIKNPLHSMVINLEVLKRRIIRLLGDEPEEVMRYVEVLNGEMERVNRRIELLLRILRPERGAEPTTLAEMVDELLELLELERERHRVTVHVEPLTVPLRGHLPRDTARQMVVNVLLDALDALPQGGTLRVSNEADESWARLRVTGSGAEAATSGAAPAPPLDVHGSGLSVVRALAEAFGGRLELERAGAEGPGEESFTIVLAIPRQTD